MSLFGASPFADNQLYVNVPYILKYLFSKIRVPYTFLLLQPNKTSSNLDTKTKQDLRENEEEEF